MGIKPSRDLRSPTGIPPVNYQTIDAVVSFKHTPVGQSHCLSACDSGDVRAALGALQLLSKMTWQMLFQGSTKDRAKKTGLNCTPYGWEDLRGVTRPPSVGEELKVFGIRASDAFRIYGVRSQNIFFVLYFDPTHSICPSR